MPASERLTSELKRENVLPICPPCPNCGKEMKLVYVTPTHRHVLVYGYRCNDDYALEFTIADAVSVAASIDGPSPSAA
jgi:hypothetical protein